MHTFHHGWIGYAFEGDSQAEVGVHKVPFGLLPSISVAHRLGVPIALVVILVAGFGTAAEERDAGTAADGAREHGHGVRRRRRVVVRAPRRARAAVRRWLDRRVMVPENLPH